MTLNKNINGSTMVLIVEGRIDTNTAPMLEGELRKSIDGMEKLVFDFNAVEYISSAGLRVLLSAQKVMNRQGKMLVKNVSDEVMDVFEVTGFADILTIE